MFREIPVHVEIDDGVRFTFAEPLSILSVTVSRLDSEVNHWQLIHDGFKPVETTESSFQSWLIDEAPEWAVEALRDMSARQAERLQVEGPRFPLRRTLSYGEVPADYRADVPAQPLTPGRYTLIVFAEQGHVSAFFDVPVA